MSTGPDFSAPKIFPGQNWIRKGNSEKWDLKFGDYSGPSFASRDNSFLGPMGDNLIWTYSLRKRDGKSNHSIWGSQALSTFTSFRHQCLEMTIFAPIPLTRSIQLFSQKMPGNIACFPLLHWPAFSSSKPDKCSCVLHNLAGCVSPGPFKTLTRKLPTKLPLLRNK